MYYIKGKSLKMSCFRTLAKTEDYKKAKDIQFDFTRKKGFPWRVKIFS